MKKNAIFLTASLLLLCACKGESVSDEYWEKATKLYEEAKEAGENVPGDIMEWVRSDFSKIGTWEYQIVDSEINDPDELTELLNSFGDERWECYFLEKTPSGRRFYLKRSAKSYLYAIPASELAKLLSRE